MKTNSLIPTEKTKPKESLQDYPILIYGRERVGKTTLCAQFESPLFLFFEPGGKALSLYATNIKNWKMFKEVLEQLENTDNFRTIVIDTVDKAYDMAFQYRCKKAGVEHPSDMKDYGKTWAAIDQEFEAAMFRLLRTGRGLIFTSHSEEKDIVNAVGETHNMTAPTASKQVLRFVRRYIDLILYYYYAKNGERWIRIQGNSDIVAGSRIDGHFKQITKFNAGSTPEEAYQNLVAAFENKLQGKERDNGKARQGVSKVFNLQKS